MSSSFPASAISLMLQENREESMKQCADNSDKIRSQRFFFVTLVFPTIYFLFSMPLFHLSFTVRFVCMCVCVSPWSTQHTVNEYERLSGWMSGMQALSFWDSLVLFSLSPFFLLLWHSTLMQSLFGSCEFICTAFFTYTILYHSL